jgi:hypothetical protein
MVFLQGIGAAALVPLSDSPGIQKIVVWAIVANSSAVTLAVIILVGWLAKTNPALLFNPQDIDRATHRLIYARNALEIKSLEPDKSPVVSAEVISAQ